MPMSAYCTGISQPAKGTILPPWRTWNAFSAVFFTVVAAAAAVAIARRVAIV